MELPDCTSLSAVLDTINEVFFYGRRMGRARKQQIAKWIASRIGQKRSYAGLPSPTEKDFRQSTTLFTGEELRSRVGIAHILGEEACRAMILLDGSNEEIQDALRRGCAGMRARLNAWHTQGMYCCGTCSVALWRHMAVGGFCQAEAHLAAGIKALRRHRTRDGQWRRFPFFYTLLALTEIKLPSAIEELRYAAELCELRLRRKPKANGFSQRRHDVMERALAMC